MISAPTGPVHQPCADHDGPEPVAGGEGARLGGQHGLGARGRVGFGELVRREPLLSPNTPKELSSIRAEPGRPARRMISSASASSTVAANGPSPVNTMVTSVSAIAVRSRFSST